MRKFLYVLIGIIGLMDALSIQAQAIRETFTICNGETVTFTAPRYGAGGPGSCAPELTNVSIERSGTVLARGQAGLTLQPEPGIYTVIGEGSCTYLDPITGRSSVNNSRIEWRYEIIASVACQDTGENTRLFEDYPWLSDLVNRFDCTTEKVELYTSSIYSYLFVTSADGTARLYDQNGNLYCQNANNFDCPTAYNFGPPIRPATWECGISNLPQDCLTEEQLIQSLNGGVGDPCSVVTKITKIDYNGSTYYRSRTGPNPNRNPDIGAPCGVQESFGKVIDCRGQDICLFGLVAPPPNYDRAVCDAILRGDGTETVLFELPTTNNQCDIEGQVFFENCDDGELYFFIRTPEGQVFDPYLGAGVSFTFKRGQQVQFGYEAASFASPCSQAQQAITITCIKEVETPTDLFTRYEWLSGLVDQTDCEGTIIFEYENGPFNFISIRDGGSFKLYFQDGTFYCQNTATFDCISAYRLGNPINSWECTTSGGCSYAETIRLNPCDPETLETALYEYNGNNYIVSIPDPSLIDAGPVVRNCSDGSTFCTTSIFFESPECNDFFQNATKLEVLASRKDCSTCANILVGGGLQEIVITDARASLPTEPIEILTVQYFNKATRVGGTGSLCSEAICPIPLSSSLSIPVEFENGNNEFEVRVTFKDGLSCIYDVIVVEVEDCICPAVYMPVCGVDGKTYGNDCEASCAGVEVSYNGPCDCLCTQEIAPVCGVDGRSYSNPCLAACSGVEVASQGECNNTCTVTLYNNECLAIGVFDISGNLLTTIAPQPNIPGQFSTWEDPIPLAREAERTYIFKDGTFEIGRRTLVCDGVANVVNDWVDYCSGNIVESELTNAGCRDIRLFTTTGDLVETILPNTTTRFRGGRALYYVLAGNDTLTVITGTSTRNFASGGCEEVEIPDTIFVCRGESVFLPAPQMISSSGEESTLIGPRGPLNSCFAMQTPDLIAIFPSDNTVQEGTTGFTITPNQSGVYRVVGQTSCCTDDPLPPGGGGAPPGGCRPSTIIDLANQYEFVVIVEEDNCGGNSNNAIFNDYPWLSDLVNPNNCSTEKITVYQQSIYNYLLITDATGNSKLYNQDGQFYCQNSSNYDCVAAYNLGNPIATWACGSDGGLDESCIIRLSSRNCRKIGVYDEADNLLTTLDPGIVPAIMVPLETWEDDRLLEVGATRTYIFKEGNFEVGRQTASCDNNNIDVKINYSSGCSDAAGLHILTNTGCRDLNSFGTSGDLLDTAAPGETLSLGSNTIHILMAGSDTLGVEVSFGFHERDVDTGGCDGNNNDAIFTDYPWLTDLINPNNCTIGRVEVYQSGIYFYLRVQADDGFAKLYNQNGQFYCQESQNYNCVEAYNLGRPIDSWTCQPTAGQSCTSVIVDLQGDQLVIQEDPLSFFAIRPEISGQINVSFTEIGPGGGGFVDTRCTGQPCSLPLTIAGGGLSVDTYTVTFNLQDGTGCTYRVEAPKPSDCLADADIIGMRGNLEFEDCKVNRIDKIVYNGEIFYEYFLEVTENCVVNYIGLVDCLGQIPCGDNGASPLCTNSNLGVRTQIWSDDTPPAGFCEILALIDFNPCDPTLKEIAVYEYRGKQYLVTEPATDTAIQDLEITAVDCETGELFCAEGELLASNPDLLLCGLFLAEATKVEVVVDRERDCPDACPQVVVCGVDGNIYPTPCAAAEAGVEASPDLTPCMQNMDCNQFRGTVLQNSCGNILIKVGEERFAPIFQTSTSPVMPIEGPRPGSIIEFNFERGPVTQITCGERTTQVIAGISECFTVVDGIICTQIPVCGVDGRTYGNACAAIIADVEIAFSGGCNSNVNCNYNYEGIITTAICSQQNADLVIGLEDGRFLRVLSMPESDLALATGDRVRLDFVTTEATNDCTIPTFNAIIKCLEVIAPTTCGQFTGTVIENACGRLIFQTEGINNPNGLVEPTLLDGVTRPNVGDVIQFNFDERGAGEVECEGRRTQLALGTIDCVTIIEASSCQTKGTIFFQNCDNGELYYFIGTDDGRVYDPYFDTNITYEPVDGQQVTFDFVDATFPSPCSIAEKAITITCLEVEEQFNLLNELDISEAQCLSDGNFTISISTKSPINVGGPGVPPYRIYSEAGSPFFFDTELSQFGGARLSFDASIANEIVIIIEDPNNPPTRTRVVRSIPNCENSVFELYPFLDREIDRFGCNAIEIFDQGSYAFVFLRLAPNRGRLYLDNGTFYCESTPTYDCLAAYGLGTPSNDYGCSNLDNVESEERAATSSSQLGFTAFPNPTTGRLTIQLPPNSTSEYQLSVHDMLGRTVHQTTVDPLTTSVELNMANQDNGVYYIELRAAGMRGIQKVVKQGLE